MSPQVQDLWWEWFALTETFMGPGNGLIYFVGNELIRSHQIQGTWLWGAGNLSFTSSARKGLRYSLHASVTLCQVLIHSSMSNSEISVFPKG